MEIALPRPAILTLAALTLLAFAASLLAAAGWTSLMALPLAVVAGLWAVPVFLALVRGERWAFVVAVAALIFLTDSNFRARPWNDKSLDWQVLLKAGVWAGCGLVGLLRLSATWRMAGTAPALLCLGFIAALLASAAWSPMPTYSIQSAVAYFWLFLFGLAAAQVLDEDSLLLALALGCGLIVLPSLAISPFAMSFAPPSPGSTGAADRLRGLADHPIPLAEISALFSFAVAALYGRTRRLILLPLFVAGLATLYLTQSRIPPLAMLAAAFGFLAYRKGGWVLMVPTITLFVVLVMAMESIAGFANLLPRDVLEIMSRSGSSNEILTLSGRLRIWPYVIDRIWEAPLIGHGHASGMEVFRGFTPWKITHAHNAYLQALLYVGAAGAALLFGVIACQLRVFFKRPEPVRDILVLYMILKGLTEQSFLSNMPSGSVGVWMVTVGMAALAWGKKPRHG